MSGLLNRLGSKSVKFELEISIHSVKLEKKQPCLIKVRAIRGKNKQQDTQPIQYHPSSKQLQLSQIFNFSCTLYKKNEKFLKKEIQLKVLELQGKSEISLGNLTIDFHSVAEKKTSIAFQEFALKDSKDAKTKLCLSLNLSERSPKKLQNKEEKKMTLNSVRRAFSVDESESLKLRQELESEGAVDSKDVNKEKVEIKADMTRKGSEKTLRKAFCVPDSEENVNLVKSFGGGSEEIRVNKARFATIRGGFAGLEEFKDYENDTGINEKPDKTEHGVKDLEEVIGGNEEFADNWKKVGINRSSSSSSLKSVENEKKNTVIESVMDSHKSADSKSSESQKSEGGITGKDTERPAGLDSDEVVKEIKDNEGFTDKRSDEVVKDEHFYKGAEGPEIIKGDGSIKSRSSESSNDESSSEAVMDEQSLQGGEMLESKKSWHGVESIKSESYENIEKIEADIIEKDSKSSEDRKNKASRKSSSIESIKSKESSKSSKSSKGSVTDKIVKNSEVFTGFENISIVEGESIMNIKSIETETNTNKESMKNINCAENENIADSASIKSVSSSGSNKSMSSSKKSEYSGTRENNKNISDKSESSSKSKNSEGVNSKSSKNSVESGNSKENKDNKITVFEDKNRINTDRSESSLSNSSENDENVLKVDKIEQNEEKSDDFQIVGLKERKISIDSDDSEEHKDSTSNNDLKILVEIRKHSENDESIKSPEYQKSSDSSNSIEKFPISPANKVNPNSPKVDFHIPKKLPETEPILEVTTNPKPIQTPEPEQFHPPSPKDHKAPPEIPPTIHKSEESDSSSSKSSSSSSLNSPTAPKPQLKPQNKEEIESKAENSLTLLINNSESHPNPNINEEDTTKIPSRTSSPELKNEKSESGSSSSLNDDLFEKEFVDSSSSVEESLPDVQVPVTDLKETVPNSASQELVLNLKEKESGLPESRNSTCCGSCNCF